jgi:esterase/lipase
MVSSDLVNAHLEGDSFYWEGGPVGVLLLHGLTATVAEVRPLAQLLHEQGYTAAGPLLPGHGTRPEDLNKVSWRDWVATAEASYHHLATVCDHVFIGGESTGAVIALHVASKYPEIAGVLAYAPAIKLGISTADLLRLYASAPFLESIPKEDPGSHPLWQGYRVNPLWGIIELIRLGGEVRQRLAQIEHPVLVVQGRQDTTIAPDSGEIILTGVSSEIKEQHWLEQSGHVVILDDEREEIADLTMRFIERVMGLQGGAAVTPLTEPALKQLLRQAAANDYEAPENLFDVSLAMMQHIGSTDAELRDGLIAPAFYYWVLDRALFEPEQMRHLLKLSLDDQHLFYKIGESGTNSVFTRTFSMLMLPLLLIVHREKQAYLTKEEVVGVKTAVLRYLQAEQDLRGHVSGPGWAHAIAHAADALDDIVQARELEADDLREILAGIRGAMCRHERPYTHEEDERMVTAVLAAYKRQLIPNSEWEAWIRSFTEHAQKHDWSPENYQKLNAKNFLRSLYFRLMAQEAGEELGRPMVETLQALSNFK